MPFNSLNFFAFFIIIYLLYISLSHQWQNRLLLAASYFFYGCFDWRFLSLIFVSTVTDYLCGIKIDQCQEQRGKRKFLLVSLSVNLGILGFFKYFNFFVDNFFTFFSLFGLNFNFKTLNILFPIGISFYTFKTLSYTIDIYRGQVKPTNDFFDYALYVSFFPQLLAGPIDRAKNLLPQIQKERSVTSHHLSEGLLLIYWGLFKKIFIADHLGLMVNDIFSGTGSSSGGSILVGIYAFSLQIYCDFSGYSDMAWGIAKLMGFDTMVNFRVPYLSTNIQEFWSRWHISLTTWIRDYLYYPLALTRIKKKHINIKLLTLITFLIMGLWHGAAWNFVIWGGYHGVILALSILLTPKIRLYFQPQKDSTKVLWKGLGVIFTFHICALGSLFFRAQSLDQASWMFYHLFANFEITGHTLHLMGKCLLYISPLLIVEMIQLRHKEFTYLFHYPRAVRYSFYSIIFYLMAIYGTQTSSFIYLQF